MHPRKAEIEYERSYETPSEDIGKRKEMDSRKCMIGDRNKSSLQEPLNSFILSYV